MSRRFAVLSALLALPLSGCGFGAGVVGSGTAETEVRPAAAFTAVDASRAVQVVIEPGETDGLTVTADDNLLPLLVAEVRGDVLVVRFTENVSPQIPVRVEASAKTLSKITASSAASVTASDLETDTLAVDLSSASHASLSGFAGSLTATLSSAAVLDAEGLAAGAVSVDASSAAKATVTAAESLTVDAGSAASVRYAVSAGVTPAVDLSSGASAEPMR